MSSLVSAREPAALAPATSGISPADLLVAIVAGVLTTVLVHLDPEGSTRSPDALAYGLGIAGAAALVLRRSQPVAVFGVVAAIHLVYHLRDYPGAGPFPSMMVALFGLAAAGLRRGAIAGAALIGLWSALVQVLSEGAALLSPTVIMPVVLATASVLAGEAAHNRSRYLAEVRERIARTEAEQELETQRRLTEERVRIARELHDIMAHTIAVITVQAGEAQDALDEFPDQTRAALRTIREASREAMSELRANVGLLREPAEATRKPVPGLRDLPELLQTASGTLETSLSVVGEVRDLPAALELTVYRIVQESLTNVIRHADAAHVSVVLRYEPSRLTVEVKDDGTGPGKPLLTEGHGIAGMRERAEAMGGRLEAGPAPDRGFRVSALLPLESRP